MTTERADSSSSLGRRRAVVRTLLILIIVLGLAFAFALTMTRRLISTWQPTVSGTTGTTGDRNETPAN